MPSTEVPRGGAHGAVLGPGVLLRLGLVLGLLRWLLLLPLQLCLRLVIRAWQPAGVGSAGDGPPPLTGCTDAARSLLEFADEVRRCIHVGAEGHC